MYKYETAIGAAGGIVALVWLIALAMGQATSAPSGTAYPGANGPMYVGPMYGLPGSWPPGFGAQMAPDLPPGSTVVPQAQGQSLWRRLQSRGLFGARDSPHADGSAAFGSIRLRAAGLAGARCHVHSTLIQKGGPVQSGFQLLQEVNPSTAFRSYTRRRKCKTGVRGLKPC